MIIENNMIFCKSFPELYEKEKTDIKNNTVRKVSLEEKNEIKKIWENKQLKIRMINTETFQYFDRNVRDISYFCIHSERWIVIITWDEGEEHKRLMQKKK